jgi:hypothetical protein
MTETLIPNAKPQIVDDAIQRSISRPLAHYVQPVDSSERTALCGAEILGVAAHEPNEICSRCARIADAVDWSLLPEEYGGPPRLSFSPKW